MLPSKSHELLPTVVQNDQHLVDASLLHQALKVETRFNDWMKRRIEEYGFEQGKDFFVTQKRVAKTKKNEYLVTFDMAKELGMLEKSPKGREIRRYFIQKEAELRRIIADSTPLITVMEGQKKLAELFARAVRTVHIGASTYFNLKDFLEFVYGKGGNQLKRDMVNKRPDTVRIKTEYVRQESTYCTLEGIKEALSTGTSTSLNSVRLYDALFGQRMAPVQAAANQIEGGAQ